MMKSADKNDNGTIEFNEFLDVMSENMEETDLEQDLRMAFRLFDEDDNGLISASELRKVLASLQMNYSDAEIERMVIEADLDGDGSISYNEFVLLVT
jgi:Ca2+-binding EF-hand superfamily protein